MTYIIQQCEEVYSQPRTSVLSLIKLIGLLSSTVQAILPGKIQFRFLQQEQISSLKRQGSYQGYVILRNLARQELLWWIENIRLSNGRKIQQEEPQMTIQTDGSTKGWEAHCNRISTEGKWSRKEQGRHINVLELMAVKFAILTFTKNLSNLTIHIQMDNKVALSFLLKMGGTHSLELLKISKSICHYLLSHGIIITAEYLPSKLSVQTDWESRNSRDPSDWKLHQSMFQSIITHFGYPTVDLFASRLCHQLQQYVAWKSDPNSIATDAIQRC